MKAASYLLICLAVFCVRPYCVISHEFDISLVLRVPARIYHKNIYERRLITSIEDDGHVLSIFEVFISKREDDLNSLNACLQHLKDEASLSTASEALVLDYRCINRAGRVIPTQYYHILIDCLFPMAPVLARALSLPINAMKDTVLATNSPLMQAWISFLTPLNVTTTIATSTSTSAISSISTATATLAPILPELKPPANRNLTMHACVPFIHTIGRYRSGYYNSSSSVSTSTSTGSSSLTKDIVLFMIRLGSSRDIKNMRSVQMVMSQSLGKNAKLVKFYGNESALDTFKLFHSASVVVGYHGAGFANTAFCKNNTLIIEFSVFMDFKMTKKWRTTDEVSSLNRGLIWKTIWLPLNTTGFRSDFDISMKAKQSGLDLDHFIKKQSVIIPTHISRNVSLIVKHSLISKRKQ